MCPDGSLQKSQEDLTAEADGGVVFQLRNIGTVSQQAMSFGTASQEGEAVENENSAHQPQGQVPGTAR